MAEKKTSSGKGLKKQLGGQPVWAWAAEFGGAVVVFLWWRSRQNAAALAAANAPTAGLPAPTGTGTGASGNLTGTQTFSSIAQWMQAAIAGATNNKYSATAAYNDFTQWMNGNCVSSSGATAIGNAITTLGMPPSGQLGAISVCASPTPPPGPPPSPTPPGGVPSNFVYVGNPTVGTQLIKEGYYLVGFGNRLYYDPSQKLQPGYQRWDNLQWIPDLSTATELYHAGYKLVSIGGQYYYDPLSPPEPAGKKQPTSVVG